MSPPANIRSFGTVAAKNPPATRERKERREVQDPFLVIRITGGTNHHGRSYFIVHTPRSPRQYSFPQSRSRHLRSPDDVSDGAIGPTGITSHRQNDAELCVTAHHARECFLRSFEWIGFNHGTHATQLGEAQGVLGIRWSSNRRALDGTLSADEL